MLMDARISEEHYGKHHRCPDFPGSVRVSAFRDAEAGKILTLLPMQTSGWSQLGLFVVVLALITKPMGLYLVQVLDANGKTWFDPVLRPLERLTYRIMGLRANEEHNWRRYTWAMLLFSMVSCLFTYAILRLQNKLPFQSLLNPQGLPALTPHLAFN